MPKPNPAQADAALPQSGNDTSNTANAGSDIQLTQDEKDALAAKRVQVQKDEQAAKIADFNAKIKEADARLAKYQGEDADTKEFREYTIATKPEAWKQINADPFELRADLKDYKLSILSPEEKDATASYLNAIEDVAKYKAIEEAARLALLAINPQYFGVEAKVKAPKKDGEKPARVMNAEHKPFTGVLLPHDIAMAKIKALHESGITSESEITRLVYPGDYSMPCQTLRNQIHPMRKKLGYVASN